MGDVGIADISIHLPALSLDATKEAIIIREFILGGKYGESNLKEFFFQKNRIDSLNEIFKDL